MRRVIPLGLAALGLMLAVPGVARAADLSKDEVEQVLRLADEQRSNDGDFKAVIALRHHRRSGPPVNQELLVYRRDSQKRMVLLFTKPKVDAGRGYLETEHNVFFYDPSVGRWERHSLRDRVNGTDARTEDFSQPPMSESYSVAYEGSDELGKAKVATRRLKLTAKPGVEVAFPTVKLWIDKNACPVKREDYALSGKLIRTSYSTQWKKVFSSSKKGDFWYPEKMVIYDELEQPNKTEITFLGIDLDPLEPNIFTKAWLESRSR